MTEVAGPAPDIEQPPLPPKGRSRPIGVDFIIYGFGMVLRRAASFIMLPIYTRILTPQDYGLLQMLDMTLDVTSILMSAGMTAGVMRFYFKATTEKRRNEVVVTAAFLILTLNFVGGLLLAIAARPIHQHVLGGAGPLMLVYVAAGNFALNELMTIPMLLMQMEGRAAAYSSTALVRLIVQLTLNIVFLIGLRMGPLGILVSTFVTNIVIGLPALLWMLRRVGFRPNRMALRDLRRFGLPYQLATAATFVVQFGDRFFLEASWGLAVVGLYGFAYQFGFLVDQLATGPYLRAWEPRRFARAHAPRAERERADNDDFHTLTLGVVTLAVGITLFIRPTLRIVAGPAFFGSANLVPILVAAFVFQAWASAVHFGIDAAEKPRYASYVMWISAALILALYAVLIPLFGAMGAAFATLVTFGARTVLMHHFSRKVWPQDYDWGPHFRILGLGIAACAGAWIIPVRGFWQETAVATAFTALYGVAVFSLARPRVGWRMIKAQWGL